MLPKTMGLVKTTWQLVQMMELGLFTLFLLVQGTRMGQGSGVSQRWLGWEPKFAWHSLVWTCSGDRPADARRSVHPRTRGCHKRRQAGSPPERQDRETAFTRTGGPEFRVAPRAALSSWE